MAARADARRPWKSRIIDHLALAVGIGLLSASVLLVGVLPDETVTPPQFQASFRSETSTEANARQPLYGSTAFILPAGGEHVVSFEVPHANVHTITLDVYWVDDHPATLADAFAVTLVAPNGTAYPYAGGVATWTPPTLADDGDAVDTIFYVNDEHEGLYPLRFNLGGVPRPQMSPGADLDEATARAETDHGRPGTAGTWQARFEATVMGDCPAVSAETLERGPQCRVQTPTDPPPARAPPDWVPADAARPERDPGNVAIVTPWYEFYHISVARA